MTPTTLPQYLLFTEASADQPQGGVWRFSLEQVGGDHSLTATDVEDAAIFERLELLAVVRGLEALDGSARVTLVTKSRYVSRGLKLGLAEWRSNGWQWERFGQVVPVRDHDLWRRIDRALVYHNVDCRLWRFVDRRRNPSGFEAAQNQRVGTRLASAARGRVRQATRAAALWSQSLPGAGLAVG